MNCSDEAGCNQSQFFSQIFKDVKIFVRILRVAGKFVHADVYIHSLSRLEKLNISLF